MYIDGRADTDSCAPCFKLDDFQRFLRYSFKEDCKPISQISGDWKTRADACAICSIVSDLLDAEASLRANESLQLRRQTRRCSDLASSKLARKTIRQCTWLVNFDGNSWSEEVSLLLSRILLFEIRFNLQFYFPVYL